MAARGSTTRARVAEVMVRLHVITEMTTGEYFRSIVWSALTQEERRALQKYRHTTLHDLLVEVVISAEVPEEFELLNEIKRDPSNHLEVLPQIYEEALKQK